MEGRAYTLGVPVVFLFCLYENCPISTRPSPVGCLPHSELGIVPSLTACYYPHFSRARGTPKLAPSRII